MCHLVLGLLGSEILRPKIFLLYMSPLAAARNRAEADLQSLMVMADRCWEQCRVALADGRHSAQWNACLEQCSDTPWLKTRYVLQHGELASFLNAEMFHEMSSDGSSDTLALPCRCMRSAAISAEVRA